MGAPLPVNERLDVQRITERVAGAVGGKAFDAAYAEGIVPGDEAAFAPSQPRGNSATTSQAPSGLGPA